MEVLFLHSPARALVCRLWSLFSVSGGRWAANISFEKHPAYREIPSAGTEVKFMKIFAWKFSWKWPKLKIQKKPLTQTFFIFIFRKFQYQNLWLFLAQLESETVDSKVFSARYRGKFSASNLLVCVGFVVFFFFLRKVECSLARHSSEWVSSFSSWGVLFGWTQGEGVPPWDLFSSLQIFQIPLLSLCPSK